MAVRPQVEKGMVIAGKKCILGRGDNVSKGSKAAEPCQGKVMTGNPANWNQVC